MGWGTKIACLYLGFITLIITMVSLTMREKIELETPDYYEQELKFQDKIDKIDRTRKLNSSLQWSINTRQLTLKFPKELKGQRIGGTIHFICPSDAKSDKNFNISTDTTLNRIVSLNGIKNRVYKIQVDWKAGNAEYYNEGVITVN